MVLALVALAPSCTDLWEEHYDAASDNLPDYNLLGYIRSNANLSIFGQMLHKTGYDTIINASQTYTIWAPGNEAVEEIDLEDNELILEMVKNHIARGNHTTSGIVSRPVKMLNGKNIVFARESSGFSFGNITLLESNTVTFNGQVHVLDGYVPYTNNIWEFIGRDEQLDLLKNFMYGQNQWLFDSIKSVEIGFDTAGNVIYDSIFIYSNPLLNELGSLDTEDSAYTVILPDNTAWEEAYARTVSYFNIPEIYGGEYRKDMIAKRAIIRDMVFRELVTEPGSAASLRSTGGNIFYSPSYLFSNAEKHELSNGIAYVTNQMPFSDTSSWFKPIKVEAEQERGRDNSNSNIYIRSGLGSGLDISGDDYIVVDPTGTSDIAQPSVEFQIPNTLSATYDIYCVFVPACIVDASNMTPGRVKFRLTYLNTTTGRTRRLSVTPENNVTDTTGLTQMFITRFDFEFANVLDYKYREVAVKLEVINDVKIDEENAGDFSRIMRIDCITLEPVFE
jgi:uncharacterized surface protein with fasciclin (FAS1) repeats